MTRRTILSVGIASATIVFSGAAFVCGRRSSPIVDERFDHAKWVQDSGDLFNDRSARFRELDDLTQRVLRIGQSKDEVAKRLGKPDPSHVMDGNPWDTDGKKASTTWAYSICLLQSDEQDQSPSPDYLVIGFDEHGKLIWMGRDCGPL